MCVCEHSSNCTLPACIYMQEMVRREMENTYGRDKLAAVNVVNDTSKLDPLLAKYNATKQKLDDLTSNYSEYPGRLGP